MRARTGNAVMLRATATNRVNGNRPTPCGASCGCIVRASVAPRARGNRMLPRLTPTTACLALRRVRRSSSTPIRNRNASRARLPRAEMTGRAAAGRRWCATPGPSQPSREGPSRTPTRISPMTGGWPSRRTAQPPAWQASITAGTASSTGSSGSVGNTDVSRVEAMGRHRPAKADVAAKGAGRQQREGPSAAGPDRRWSSGRSGGGSGPQERQGGAAQRSGNAGHLAEVDGDHLDPAGGQLASDPVAAFGDHDDAGGNRQDVDLDSERLVVGDIDQVEALVEPADLVRREDAAVDESGTGRDDVEVVVEVDDAAGGEPDRRDFAVDVVLGERGLQRVSSLRGRLRPRWCPRRAARRSVFRPQGR